MTLSTIPSPVSRSVAAETRPVRRVQAIHFCPWAGRLEDGGEFLAGLSAADLRSRVSDPADPRLMQMARLDCDWHGENVRALGSMRAEGIEFLPLLATGRNGLFDVLKMPGAPGVERWFIISGQHPGMLGEAAGRLFGAYARQGIRILYYAFDEASRTMPCFQAIAPLLSVLIHDEDPLEPAARRALAPGCAVIHRSWVANLEPFAVPFLAEPEEAILFLGSKLGLTPHRQRQIDYLSARYKDRFTAVCDHSLPVGDRERLNRFKVGFCPEGRKFATPAMSRTHTDRPFWSGCLGLAPVSEDSRAGGRLEELHRAGLIWRYPHGDLKALGQACDRALAASAVERRSVYEHFNRQETVGAVVAAAIRNHGTRN